MTLVEELTQMMTYGASPIQLIGLMAIASRDAIANDVPFFTVLHAILTAGEKLPPNVLAAQRNGISRERAKAEPF